jgi:hypothetical protein
VHGSLRGGYPEERWSNRLYPVRSFTNYEFLMTQYRPQDSVLLVGVDYTMPEAVPVITRATKLPWTDEVTLCQKNFPARQCEFLQQQPDKLVQQSGGKYQYTFARTDLGQIRYCATDMFCNTSNSTTRTEPMLWARRTNGANGTPTMRFNLNDTFAGSLGGRARVRVVYLDKGTGKWELRYDSSAAADKSALVVQKTNSNQWKEVWVDLADAAFTNRMPGNTDIALSNMGDDDDIFHMIEVTRSGQTIVPLQDPEQTPDNPQGGEIVPGDEPYPELPNDELPAGQTPSLYLPLLNR